MKATIVIIVIVVVLVSLNYFGFFIPLNQKGLPGVGKCKSKTQTEPDGTPMEGNYAYGWWNCAT